MAQKASRSWGGALWERGSAARPHLDLGLAGSPLLLGPTPPSHPISKQRAVLGCVTPSKLQSFTALSGEGFPPPPRWCGSSSHSRTRIHCCFARCKMVLTNFVCKENNHNNNKKSQQNTATHASLARNRSLPRKPQSRPGRCRAALSDQGSLKLHEPRSLNQRL